MGFLILIITLIIFTVLNSFKISDLRSRVQRLEKIINQKNQDALQLKDSSALKIEAPAKIDNSRPFTDKETSEEKMPEKDISSKPSFAKKEPGFIFRFFAWLKEDWILKLGSFLILLGFGWLVTYAFLNNLIGASGRIAFGLIFGSLVLFLGYARIKKYLHQGGVFVVLGAAIILLTIFAARELYDMFNPFVALVIMFATSALVALLSLKYRVFSLALSGLVLAFIAPLLINSPDPSFVGLSSYLFVVSVGALWIVALTGWGGLALASLLGVFFYIIPSLYIIEDSKAIKTAFSYAFTFLFLISNLAGILKGNIKNIKANLITAGGLALFVVVWTLILIKEEWQSLLFVFWMIVFSLAAFFVFKITENKRAFYIYFAISLAMLVAATTVQLKGATLTMAYIVEGVVLSILSYYLLKDAKLTKKTVWFMVLPVIFSFASMLNYQAFNKDFFVLVVLSLAFYILGIFSWFKLENVQEQEGDKKDFGFFGKGLMLVGAFYTFIFSLNSIVSSSWNSSVFNKDFVVLLSVIFGLCALCALFFSKQLQKREDAKKIGYFFLIFASFYVYVFLWLVLHAALNYDTATLVALVIYTIIGLFVYTKGKIQDNKAKKLYGAILFGFVVFRLIFIDAWDMELTMRVFVFILVGILLTSSAFLGKKANSKKLE